MEEQDQYSKKLLQILNYLPKNRSRVPLSVSSAEGCLPDTSKISAVVISVNPYGLVMDVDPEAVGFEEGQELFLEVFPDARISIRRIADVIFCDRGIVVGREQEQIAVAFQE